MFNLLANDSFFGAIFEKLKNAFNFSYIFGNLKDRWYLYLILFIIIVGFIVFVAVKKQTPRHNLSETKKLTYVSMMVALCTVINVLTVYPVTYIAISFVMTVTFIGGYLFGAKSGFVIGFVGDLIQALLFPAGVYNPLIGIASGLMGFIPGFIFDNFKGNAYIKTVISCVICLVVCTAGFNTFGLWLMYGMGKKTFWAYLWVRLPWQVLVTAGNCTLCCVLANTLPRILPKKTFNL